MYRFRKVAIIFLLVSLVFASTAWASNGSVSDDRFSNLTAQEVSKSNDFRKQLGFPPIDTELGSINGKLFSSKAQEKYGALLTDEELALLEKRIIKIDEASKLQENIENIIDIADSYGGMYFDHHEKNGVLKIGLVSKGKSRDKLIKVFSDLPEKGDIVFYDVTFSYNELEKIHSQIDNELVNAEISDWFTAISTKENKIVIATENNYERVNEILSNKFNKQLYDVREANGINGLSRSAYTRPVYGGLEIVNTSNSGKCTTAFTGVNAGKRFIVTAGHCASGLGEWFTQGGLSLGTVTVRQLSGNTDALGIAVNINNESGKIYGDANVVDINTGLIYTTGAVVCKSGISTGVTCGTITYGTVSYTQVTSLGTVNLSNQFAVAADAQAGDSGSPTYYPNATYNGKTGSKLTGVLSGGGEFDGQQLFISSKLSNVMSNLGLTGVIVGD
ncbi:hypothetical protein A7K91_05010 [Paenibacillus oryzae]|uniref:Serine protease n=1 Tax=Paenibacillus oryzae TaxID=1844972 RepID=A0A1A5YH71_9BACL|nr:S1 family peptidase [Paenibacillus oryzae]OBR64942.1 hypothetical protein A7K91_05010 [Paenibacillus oryzae]